MLFNSAVFAAFFAFFFPLFLACRRNVFARNLLILAASYFFYGWWDARFLILIAVSTSVDYIAALGVAGQTLRREDFLKSGAFLSAATIICVAVAARTDLWILPAVLSFILVIGAASWLIHRAHPDKRRRYWLVLSLTCNLGILAFFKYFNFFVGSMVDGLNALGVTMDTLTLHIILPVGLSFYTFQGLSRTIDAYRGRIEPRRSIINYAAYLAFFPQLVAGPIERASHLLPQFEAVRPLNLQMFWSGALLFLWGLYTKIVIADNVAPIANAVFGDPTSYGGAATWAAVLAFAFQIYCDFSGYSNMARGLSRCLGFDLMVNFNLPYFARTPSEFWQRWHISLSSWLRDYLYIPLGGNRHGTAMMYRNLMITMLLGGLWHGAAWTFVVWGAFHGAIQVLFRILKIDAIIEAFSKPSLKAVLVHMGSWLATMILILIGWVFFRARSFPDAMQVLQNLVSPGGYNLDTFIPLLKYITPLVLVEIYLRWRNAIEPLWIGPFMIRYAAALTVLLSIVLFSASGGQEFIYFDF